MRVTIKAYETPKSKVNSLYAIKQVRYVISTDPTFSATHLKDVTKTLVDDKLMEFSFEYDFPKEEILYGYTEITYVNNEVERSTTCRLNYLQPGFSFNNNIIATPTLSIKGGIDNDLVPTKNIELELSEFIMFQGYGNLDSTTWKIYDSNNKLLLERKRDTFNKTSFIIPDNVLEENKLYRVEAVYFNNYDSESFPATLIINTIGGFNSFSIDNASINFVNNGISVFNTRCNFVNFQHLRIDIYNSNNELVLENFISTSKYVTIPKMGLLPGERYYTRVFAVYLNNRGEVENSQPIEFATICKDIGFGKEYDINYNYNNKFNIVKYDFNNLFINKLGGYTEQLENGDIPFYKVNTNTIEIRYFKFFNNTLTDTNRGFVFATNNTIKSNTNVNIKMVTDLITGVKRLIVAFDLINNKVEIRSFVYSDGEFGNVDLNASAVRVLDNAQILNNSSPIIDFKDDEFLLGIVPIVDNKNLVVFKKDLSSHSYISNLYQAESVIGNSTSVFKLPDDNILKISSDTPIQKYGIYNITDNNFVDKGILPAEMQNITGDLNANQWFGFDRQDGNTLLIPKFYTIEKFELYLYDYYNNIMKKTIAKEDLVIPGKYEFNLLSTIEKIYSIELKNGTLLLMLSGTKSGTDYKDIWQYS